MPIYEYQCQSCGHEMESIQKMSDQALTDCPQCGKAELKKLISAAGFQLKGAGWYETDFKNGNKKPAKDPGSESKPAAATGGCGTGACGCAASTPKH